MFNEDLATDFFKKKLIHVKQKVSIRFRLFKIVKALSKNIPRRHSPEQNKKAVLNTAAYFKVSTPIRLQRE